jgi:peptide methionine sulfoxide reductase MsrA
METATFGAGCFWGVEARLQHLPGVIETAMGYEGGKAVAKATIARLTEQKTYKKPIVTQVVPAQTFWRAEEYHQKYLEKRGALSCHI